MTPPEPARVDLDHLPGHLEELIGAALTALQHEAKALADEYWGQTLQDNAAHPTDPSYLGVRARAYANQQTSSQWFRQQVVAATNPQTGRRRVFSHYLPKGISPRYSEKTLAAVAPAWQIETVLDYEARFAVLRQRQAALVAVRRTVRRLASVWNPAEEAGDAV